MRRSPKTQLALTLFFAGMIPCTGKTAEVDFESQISPILEERCWHCHGEDEQESGLRLDRRANLLLGGDSGLPTIVPGDAKKSYLVEVINHVDEDMAMPPDDDKMPDEEIELLTKWIQEGANWPGQMDEVVRVDSNHWAFQSVDRPRVPVGESEFSDKQLSAVDAFLLSRLQKEGLTFSDRADARTLVRRLSIVLTGLIPTPDQVDEFVEASQSDPDRAYEHLVDQLLQSPQFGERWAQHWLDVIRWAETNGSEANLYRKNAWIYRDYVVRAFNEDKPYDQFVQEQIAGDSMGAGEATGFLVAGPHVPAATVGREPSAIRQARADRMDEIMQTVGASVMGVTIGCARCHNHKFDPISIKDYYSMTGVFQDIEFGSRFPEFSKDHPRRQRGEAIWKRISTQRRELRKLGGWEENWGAFRELHFPKTTTKSIRIRFKLPNIGLDELEVLGPVGSNENYALAIHDTQLKAFPFSGIEGRNPADRLIDGEYGTMTWRAKLDAKSKDRPWVELEFSQPREISRLRLSSNREYFYDTDYLDKKPYLPRYEFDIDIKNEAGEWKPLTGTWFVNKKLNEKHPDRSAYLKEIQSAIALLADEGPRPSFVGRFIRPAPTHVLLRGSPENPRDEVVPAGPAIFDGDLNLTSKASGRQRRAEFAKWIVNPDNPLTARVMVNRIWHHVFGTGIVSTTSDFGTAGAPPTHPELLDWLAAEFVSPSRSHTDGETSQPWSIKSMIRMLVMSTAFQQSSAPRDEGLKSDAGSMLLWRFPPKRVEAEVIRDSILQTSDCLDKTIGGRSYRIHNEKKTYAQWQVINNYGPETWRRMLYQERMRRVDDQMFTAFDFPDCGQVRAKRPVSTTPLQALNLMNSDFVMDQSKRIADRAMKDSGDDLATAIERCFELLLGRTPVEEEKSDCITLAKETNLALVCRAIINSNEFAFLP